MDPALLPLCPLDVSQGGETREAGGSRRVSNGSSFQALLQRLGLLSFHPFS